MSSPNLNNLILVGGILAYISMIFFGVDASLVPQSSIALMCKVRLFMIRENYQTVDHMKVVITYHSKRC